MPDVELADASGYRDDIGERLVARHKHGDDRAATAIACGVHPTVLHDWLTKGLGGVAGPVSRFALEFARVESDIRCELLQRVLGTSNGTRQQGAIWYLERRFPVWRKGYVHQGAEGDAMACLGSLEVGRGGLTREQKLQVIEKLFANPTPELRQLMAKHGWRQEHEEIED